MAFLFQDQNQGIRNDAPRAMRLSRPFSFIRTLTVGFGVTPNLLTLFPKGIPTRELQGKKALAGLGCFAFTAGGDFHPALRTSAARYEQPDRNYGESRGCQQAASASKNCMFPMPGARDSGPTGRKHPEKLTIGAREGDASRLHSARRTRLARIRFRFVLTINNCVRDQLWMSSPLPVDGVPVQLRRFGKSHHLILASSRSPQGAPGLHPAATRHFSACRPAACV